MTQHHDVIVCGAGAGGSMAAYVAAKAGMKVLLLEEGAAHSTERFTMREEQMIPALYQQLGGQRTRDLGILVLSGRGLGGSTAHNTNLCKRIAAPILEHWAGELGLSELGTEALAPYFDKTEALLGVRTIRDDQVNRQNQRLGETLEKLSLKYARLAHNRDERCQGSGYCDLGCPNNGKLNALRVLIPEVIKSGGEVRAGVDVRCVLHRGGAVVGVEVVFGGERQVLRAPKVVLAGGAVGSAAMALRSALPDRYRQLGRGLHLHPAALVAGVFDERIEGYKGVPQSVECSEWMDYRPGAKHRVWIVPVAAHPASTAALMPGFGPSLMRDMRDYARLMTLIVMVHDESEGRVKLKHGAPVLDYRLDAGDQAQLAFGAKQAARILFEAGAKEVVMPAAPAIRGATMQNFDALTPARFGASDIKLNSVHPLSTMRMGLSPEHSAIGTDGQVHGVRGLYVADGSVFPTSLGGPPQIGIYAMAMKIAAALS